MSPWARLSTYPRTVKAKMDWNIDLWLWLHSTTHKTCPISERLWWFMLELCQEPQSGEVILVCQVCGKAKWVAKQKMIYWGHEIPLLGTIHGGLVLRFNLLIMVIFYLFARYLSRHEKILNCSVNAKFVPTKALWITWNNFSWKISTFVAAGLTIQQLLVFCVHWYW